MLNLPTICEDYLGGRHYRVEVIDLAVEPHLGDEEKIVSTPVLNRATPGLNLRVVVIFPIGSGLLRYCSWPPAARRESNEH
jgi:hypothetical protein